jgi:hypothetical protein
MHAFLTQLARKRLRQLPDGSAPSSIRSELRTATQRAEGTSKNQRLLISNISGVLARGRNSDTYAFLASAICKRRFSMISVKSLNALLRECKRPANIRLQAVLELFARLREERLLGAVLHAVDCDFGF